LFLISNIRFCFQSLALLLAALGPKDVSRVVTGPLTDYTVHFLRHLRDFFEVVFKLEKFGGPDEEYDNLNMGADKVLLTCVGVGFTNLSKRTT
jgi:RNA 3'-terminal phosphate cyclase-like protein